MLANVQDILHSYRKEVCFPHIAHKLKTFSISCITILEYVLKYVHKFHLEPLIII